MSWVAVLSLVTIYVSLSNTPHEIVFDKNKLQYSSVMFQSLYVVHVRWTFQKLFSFLLKIG